jgi:hypothetical protein
MDKIDVSEFLGKRGARDASPARRNGRRSDLTYNAFLGFPVASALADVIRRLKGPRGRRECELDTFSETSGQCGSRVASPASGKGHVSDLTYNAFFGFAVTKALKSWARRLKTSTVHGPLGPDTSGHEPPANPVPDSQRADMAFGELPPVPGSTKITFRN